MPQISKIRIVNCNYNDGKRLIPDELYDLVSNESGEALNTLFNLNNGGGKTVLVQLIMQPVNPKAMAGGRRIEDYFTRSGDHSFVLIEWNLDGSKEKLLTGIAIAASQSMSQEDNQRGNAVKYYTFKTTYTDYSPYNIAALELSRNEGGRFVPAEFDYVREKAKSSKGALEYYSSDESVKWTDLLAQYGIFKSEWESVIETLNRDEGGLNQYFDDAKTSDKLISKFFIPAIEQKMRSVSSKGTDSSLETMLINYAKKISEKENVIQERDTNKKLLEELSILQNQSDELYTIHDELEKSISMVFGFRAALNRKKDDLANKIAKFETEILSLEEQLQHIDYEKKSKAFYVASEEFDAAKQAFDKAEELLRKSKEELAGLKHDIDVLQCAKLYQQIIDAENEISVIQKLILEKENSSEDAERIKRVKYSVLVKAREQETVIGESVDKQNTLVTKMQATLEETEKKKTLAEKRREGAVAKYNKAEAALNEAKKSSDRYIERLEIDIVRQLDGFYQDELLEMERCRKDNQLKAVKSEQERCSHLLNELEIEKDSIPEKRFDIKRNLLEKIKERENVQTGLSEYQRMLLMITGIAEKHNLNYVHIFNGRLLTAIQEDIKQTEADIRRLENDKEIREERMHAAEKGHVHVVSSVIKYVESTGINCQTGEEYLCSLVEEGKVSREKLDGILLAYPEIAYALVFDTEKKIVALQEAGNIDWLPAAVPLVTMEQMEQILAGNMQKSKFLAAFDKEYFANRHEYMDKLSSDFKNVVAQIERLENYLKECKEDEKKVQGFSYSETWESEQTANISELQEIEAKLEKELDELDEQEKAVKAEIVTLRDIIKGYDKTISELERWFDNYAELSLMLGCENEAYNDQQSAYKEKRAAESEFLLVCDEYQKYENAFGEYQTEMEALQKRLNEIREMISEVSDTIETDVEEGDLDGLFTQYKTLCNSLHSDLAELRKQLEDKKGEKKKASEELEGFECALSEYEAVIYSLETLQQKKETQKSTEAKVEECQAVYNECNGRLSGAKVRLDAANDGLSEYNGVALPRNEVGENYKLREKEISQKINSTRNDIRIYEKEIGSLGRIIDQANDLLESVSVSDYVIEVQLMDSIETQWKGIKNALRTNQDKYDERKEQLLGKINHVVGDFKNQVLSEIISKLEAVGKMLIDAGIKGDRLFTVSDSISTMVDSIEKINNKIAIDLAEIENDFNDIVSQCMNQGKRMYSDLYMIANSSKARIYEGKPQTQMVKMDLPDEKEVSEEASRVSIENEIRHGAEELKVLLRSEADAKQILKKAKSVVGSEKLLHKYIRQDSIQVRVFKIDINSENSMYKRWEDTLTQNSGAEKFVIFFAVVLTLMNYTRSTTGIISKQAKSTLVLDNPFGKITSAHLLKPMFDIAKHFNVQLICLSDINKSDVINCFDNVIKLVIREQNLSNHAIMTHEGNEKIEHGFYKVMYGQMSLFT